MKENVIVLKDVLKEIEQSVKPDGSENPFSIEFYTCSEKGKNNGRLVKIESCIKQGKPGRTVKSIRGLFDLNKKESKSCNIWLIHKFNGSLVKW